MTSSTLSFLDFAKIQFLKAIHNDFFSNFAARFVFRFCKNTIFESNSQRNKDETNSIPVFRFCKNTIFESNSQLAGLYN